MRLEGSWKPGRSVDQIDMHTAFPDVIRSKVGAINCNAPMGRVWGDRKRLRLQTTYPGIHSLYFGIHKDTIFWGEREWPIKKKLYRLGYSRPKVRPVHAGELWVFDGVKAVKHEGDTWKPPRIDHGMGMEEAGKEFARLFLEAADEMHALSGRPPVTCLLSGGTDSTLTAWALKEIGADVHCMTIGVSEDDFDPTFAKIYAKDLDLPHTFIKLPTTQEALVKLCTRAIFYIETPEFSNTLMAMCTSMARDLSAEMGRPILYHGHLADEWLGYWMQSIGGYKAMAKQAGIEVSAAGWQDKRAEDFMHTTPNNVQIAKISRVGNDSQGRPMDWRCIFSHPKVSNFLLSRSLDVTPCTLSKPLFYEVLNPLVSHRAWDEKKKIGYYSGSGIGTLRREHTFMSEEGLPNTYRQVRASVLGPNRT